MTIKELKNYLRIDHDFDDSLIETFKIAAENYIYGAIETEQVNDKRFDLAVALLVGHWYKNREATSQNNLKDIPLGVLSIIQQLRGLPTSNENGDVNG